MTNYVNKSIKGKSIITNIDIEGSCNINTHITNESGSNYDIGSTIASFRNGYFENLIVAGSSIGNYVKNQINSTLPIFYNSTSGNISLNINNGTLRITNGNLSVKDNLTTSNPLNYTASNLSLNIDTNTLKITGGNLAVNESYIKNLFTSSAPLKTTDGNTIFNFNNTQLFISSGNLNINPSYIKNIFSASAPLKTTDGNLSLLYSNPFTTKNNNLELKLAHTFDLSSNLLQKIYVNTHGELDVNVDGLIYCGQGLKKIAVLDEMLTLGLNTAGIDIPELTVLAVNADPLIFNYSSFITGNYLTMKNLGITRIPFYDTTGYTTNYKFTYTSATDTLNAGNVEIIQTTRLSNNNLAASVGYVKNLNEYLTNTPIFYTDDGDSRIWNIRYDNNTIGINGSGELISKLSVAASQPINLDPDHILSFGYNNSQFSIVSGLLSSTLIGIGAISLNPSNEISVDVDTSYLQIVSNKITFATTVNNKLDKIDSLNTEVDSAKSRITSSEGKITTLEGKDTVQDGTLNTHTAQITALEGAVGTATALGAGGAALGALSVGTSVLGAVGAGTSFFSGIIGGVVGGLVGGLVAVGVTTLIHKDTAGNVSFSTTSNGINTTNGNFINLTTSNMYATNMYATNISTSTLSFGTLNVIDNTFGNIFNTNFQSTKATISNLLVGTISNIQITNLSTNTLLNTTNISNINSTTANLFNSINSLTYNISNINSTTANIFNIIENISNSVSSLSSNITGINTSVGNINNSIVAINTSISNLITVSNPFNYTVGNLSLKYANSLHITVGNLAINESYISNLFSGEAPIIITQGKIKLDYDSTYLALTLMESKLSFSEQFILQCDDLDLQAYTTLPSAIIAEETRAIASEALLSAGILTNTTSIAGILTNTTSIGIINGSLNGYNTNFSTANLKVSNDISVGLIENPTTNRLILIQNDTNQYLNIAVVGVNSNFSGNSIKGDTVIRSSNNLILQSGTGNAGIIIDTSNIVKILNNLNVSGIINANSTINCGIINSNLTGGTNIFLTNYDTGNNVPLSIINPNLSIGSNVEINLGVSNSTYNLGVLQFNYNGNGSLSNTLGLGFYGANNLLTMDANGQVSIASKLTVGGNNVWNKKLVLYDNAPSEGVTYGTDFYGFGINNSTLRYQAPTGGYHRFYAGTTGVILSLSEGAIILNRYTTIFNNLDVNSLSVKTYTVINSQGGYMEWNRSAGGGELEITNQVGGGNDNSIYLGGSDASNNRTKWWRFYNGGIQARVPGNTFFDILGGGQFIFGYSTGCDFQVYRGGIVQLGVTTAGAACINLTASGTISSAAIVSSTLRSLTGLRIDGWGSTNYSIECFAGQSISSSTSVNVGYNIIFKASSGVVTGSVYNNGSNCTFSISSDYRVKKNVKMIENALETISKLKPCNYLYKINDHQADGFIAHELQEVLPYAVVGEKDAVDDKGEMIIQGVDYSMLTPILTAGIQELIKENTLLKERLDKIEKLMKL